MSDDSLDRRINRIEDVIERLTSISGDLNRILAVHEQRIVQQEKDSDILYKEIEKRRDETEKKIKEIYDNMNEQEKNIFDEISNIRKEINEQYSLLNQKITQIEKFNWMAIGGGIVISWVIGYLFKFLKLF